MPNTNETAAPSAAGAGVPARPANTYRERKDAREKRDRTLRAKRLAQALGHLHAARESLLHITTEDRDLVRIIRRVTDRLDSATEVRADGRVLEFGACP